MSKKQKFYSSQALLELVLAIFVFAIVAAGLAGTVSSLLFAGKGLEIDSKISFLLSSTQEQIKNISDEDWHSIYNLNKGPCSDSSCHYKIVKSDSQWQVQPGEETITLDGVDYIRYFVVFNVLRDPVSGDIVESGGVDDPLTQKIVVFVKTDNVTRSSTKYISRCHYDVFPQGDWSGGAAGDIVVSGSTNQFATSSNINFSSSSIIMLSQ